MQPLLLVALLLGCGEIRRPVAHRMAPCPPSPNCVSSLADPADPHHVAPLPWRGEGADDALGHARDAAEAMPRTTLVHQDEGWVHLVAVTPLVRFRDDLELQVDPEARVVHVRSASRVGRSDLGVNRRRVERLRQRMQVDPP